ncbi:hypothetical protein HY629_02125 [Candidatus Uhrbacteria bacterium]|nr:hypothetical protein [Candidatus Uhrbacteria bacterium]
MEEIRNTILLVVFLISIFYMMKERRRVLAGQVIQEPLTRKEKILMWVLCIFNPIIAGAVFYYGWIKKLPVKARQANRISIIAFFISLIVVVSTFSVLLYYSGKAEAEYAKKFQQARQLIQDKKFDEAQIILLALNKENKSSGVYYNLAITYEAQSNLDKAIVSLSRAVEIEPTNTKTKQYLDELQLWMEVEQALILAEQGNIAAAKQKLLMGDTSGYSKEVIKRVEERISRALDDPRIRSLYLQISDY